MTLLRVMLKTFIKTIEGWNIIWLDYCGYHLVDSQIDLTIAQQVFLVKGRFELHKQMNTVEEK